MTGKTDTAAVLTPKQRDYLTGDLDNEPSESAQRAMRSRIRDRIHQSFYDFQILERELDLSDRQKVVDELDHDVTPSLVAMVAFVHQTADALDLDTRKILQAGVERGQQYIGDSDATVMLDFEISHGTDQLLKRFRAKDPTLTWPEVWRLEREGLIDTDERDEFYDEVIQSPASRGGGRVAHDTSITTHDEIEPEEVTGDEDSDN